MKPYETTAGTPTRADGSTPFTHHKPVEYRECDCPYADGCSESFNGMGGCRNACKLEIGAPGRCDCPQCLASRQDAEDRIIDAGIEQARKDGMLR